MLDGVGLTYAGPPAVRALIGADLKVMSGEYVTITGPSGSGKSTFLNVLGLLDRPTLGDYLLDGIDTGAMSNAQRTRLRGERIGFVFQAYHLLPGRTATENVELALIYQGVSRRERSVLARDVLRRVGLEHRADADASRLSGGERQRVAIARALVGTPSILLCDEPTGNLDSGTADTVLALLRSLHRDGITLVVITHDPGVAGEGQRRLTITDGFLSGPTADAS
jgi:putative ABC transport system ATP-binding protein